ncbi:SAM hydrolase/SAM-dependent halogenase family protein [Thiolapillus sp.]
MPVPIVYFFTDFGIQGPYLGQMESVLLASSRDIRVINLMCDAPFANPRAGAYLLAALSRYLPQNAVVVAVVDPGVGSPRRALCLQQGERWYVAPDNGLLSMLSAAAGNCRLWEIDPSSLPVASASFHGRDIFAPVAGKIVCGEAPGLRVIDMQTMVGASWPTDLEEIVYVDGFGNAMTGISASSVPGFQGVVIGGHSIRRATTFSSVAIGELFCYVNSIGLVEIAVNQGNATEVLQLCIGHSVDVIGEDSVAN